MCLKKVGLLLLMAILVWGMMPAGYAVTDRDGNVEEGVEEAPKMDNKPDPLTTAQLELKGKALESKLSGKDAGNTVEVAKGQFVELAREGEGAIWTVLGEFADLAHNTLPAPDRAVNNTTIWVPDFSSEYYMDILFNDANSMRNYYIEQSSNRYTVHGDVTDWVLVPQNHIYYNDDPDSNVWYFLEDSVNGWYDSQIAAGKTPAEINYYLSQFDVWDRYDYNGNGNFDEPDGYIDTFQSVHAGEGEEAGAPATAIWSHSWYARYHLIGFDGPSFNLSGGIQVGNSDYWIGKYTIQPENGGVGVFAHEFGHDLGLPDLYDTSPGAGENSTAFWTLMSSGSWLGDGMVDIGSKPSHMGAWEKFQLGWLNYEVAYAGQKSIHRLGPMEFNTKQAQGVFVILPKKGVITNIGAPYAGSYYYYSGAGDNLNNLMYKPITLTGGATLTAKVKYNIELDWDYAYLVVSYDGGASWVPLQTNLSSDTNPNGQNFGHGITGISSSWVDLTADLTDITGDVLLGFRYWTDTNTGGFGFMIDNVEITGFALDGAETDAGWTFDGFMKTNGTESALFNNYYVCEYRSYLGYDSVLKTGPYYFGYADNPELVDLVDHFPYQDGLLIHYWDTSQRNNQTRLHPGTGLLLPIDAHFEILYRWDGVMWRNRIQSYDSTFTISPTEGIPNLHHLSVLDPVPSLPGVKVFDDRITYYDPANPLGSVMNPNTGTMITVLQEPYLKVKNPQAPFMQIQVSPAK